MAAKSKSNEIKITRVYDAPVQAVWDAWTDPEQVAQWWGPRGFTLTTHSKDLRPAGTGTTPCTARMASTTRTTRNTSRWSRGSAGLRPRRERGSPAAVPRDGAVLRAQRTHAAGHDHDAATPEAAEETRGFIKKAGGNPPGTAWPSTWASESRARSSSSSTAPSMPPSKRCSRCGPIPSICAVAAADRSDHAVPAARIRGPAAPPSTR